MDFSFTEAQEAVRELASRILGDLSTPERLKEIEASEDRIDRRLWKELGSAGLLSVALDEASGGAGLGFLAAGIVSEEVGRVAAAVPYWSSVVGAALPIARFGNDQQKTRWLEPLVAGDAFIAPALGEPGGDLFRPSSTAKRDGDGWMLEGTKSCVPAAYVSDAMIVSATCEDGSVGLFLVGTDGSGVQLARQEATDGSIEAEAQLTGARVGAEGALVKGDDGPAALAWLIERAQAAICLEIAGACQTAVKLTAEYTTGRKQFDKSIATFQAVGQRAADAHIDAEAVRLTAWQAAWRLSERLPATAEVAVAKFWADEGAQRVVHAASHLHGGVGVDRDYPLHRYFLLVKHLALTLGGTTPSLLRLGEVLATAPA